MEENAGERYMRIFISLLVVALVVLILWSLSGCTAFDRWQTENKRLLAEAQLMQECRRMIQLGQQGPCLVAITMRPTRVGG